MAVFNTTRKKYFHKWEEGKVWYNTLNAESQQVLSMFEGSIANDAFHLTEFYTDLAKGYFDNKQYTWVFFKCNLSNEACREIITNTEFSTCVEHYALCMHDKDTENGKIKPSHTHVCLKFFRNERINKLVDYFHCEAPSNCLHNARARFNYLMHDSDACRKQGKYQYPIEEVISDDINFWLSLNNEVVENTASCILDDILAGKSERYLCNKYQDRYVLNRSKYHESARVIAKQENLRIGDTFEIHSIDDNILTIYDKETGNLVEVARNLDEIRWKVGLNV